MRSRARARVLVLLASLGAFASVPPAGGAAAAPRAEPEPRPAGPCKVKVRDVAFTSFDGVELDATYYVPSAATPRTPQPAILTSHGFGGWHRGDGDVADHRMLASHCYVVLAWTERGFGRSGGEVELLDPAYEVRDARLLVDWLARRAEVLRDGRGDPRVGMFGGSYGGGIQTLLATHDRRVDVITPQVTWNDLRYSLYPNGAIKNMWINLLFASGTASAYCGANYAGPGCEPSPPGMTPEIARYVATATAFNGDPNGEILRFLAKRSPATYARRWRVPTLLVQGIGDTLFTINEAIRNYRIVRGNGAPAKLILFNGGHGQSESAIERRHINRTLLRWFARHLRRDRSVDTGAALEVAHRWVGDGHRFVGYADVPSREAIGFQLSDGGGLVPPGSLPGFSGVPVVNSVAPTSYSEISNFQSSSPIGATDAAEPVTAASFATAPLRRPLTVIGQPSVRFSLTSTAGEAIVFWKLYDVAPDGSYELLHNVVTPIRLLGPGDWPANAPIAEPVTVNLGLQSIVHRFPAGHRIVLTAATTDTAHYGSRVPAVHVIGGGSRAGLSLPAA